jgi:hypothetical protein
MIPCAQKTGDAPGAREFRGERNKIYVRGRFCQAPPCRTIQLLSSVTKQLMLVLSLLTHGSAYNSTLLVNVREFDERMRATDRGVA